MKQKFIRPPLSQISQMAETPLPVPLRVDSLRRDPKQPRTKRNPEKVQGLADSMKSNGQLQAIIVREIPGEDGHMIVIGEGRWLAAQINNAEFINCVITQESDSTKILAMQIVENLQREDVDELDTAQSYRSLINLGVCKNATDVGALVGVSDATVSVYLNILKASPEIKELIEKGIATIDTARTLTKIQNHNPALATSLIKLGHETGKLKRDVVRAAEAADKSKAGTPEPAQKLPDSNSETAGAAGGPVPDTNKDSGAQLQADANGDTKQVDVQQPPVKSNTQGGTAGEANSGSGLEKNAKPTEKKETGTANSGAPVESKKEESANKPAGIVVVDRYDVHVTVRTGAATRPTFDFNMKKHGPAILAHDMVHADLAKAWLHFGAGTDESMLVPFPVADLVILKITRQE